MAMGTVPQPGHTPDVDPFNTYGMLSAEHTVDERLREFDRASGDNRWYEYHYLEHHLRDADDERLMDDRRTEESARENRAADDSFRERSEDAARSDRIADDRRMADMRIEMEMERMYDEMDADIRDDESRMRMERDQDDDYRFDDD